MRRKGDVIVFPRTNVSAVLVRQVFGAWEAIITDDPNGNYPQGATAMLDESQLALGVKGYIHAS